jgi:hypothetical protein
MRSGGDFPPNGVDKSVKAAAKDTFGPIRLPREMEIASYHLSGIVLESVMIERNESVFLYEYAPCEVVRIVLKPIA